MKYLRLIIHLLIISFWSALILASLFFFTKQKPFSKEDKTLNIFVWGDFFNLEAIHDFEKKTGIKIHLHYYISNEELLVKLKGTQEEAFDLIAPSDYAVDLLVKENLLRPLNKEKLPCLKEIDPFLLSHSFDPKNAYSLPYTWEIFGFGIDSTFFKNRPIPKNFSDIFQPLHYKIAMTPDPVEAICYASYSLFGPKASLSLAESHKVKELLIKQKDNVEAYADNRARYLLATRNCPLAVLGSSFVWQMSPKFKNVRFIEPEEVLFTTIESFAIPKNSQKEDLVYTFLNDLYRPEVMAKHLEVCPMFPASLKAFDFLKTIPGYKETFESAKKKRKKIQFIRHLLPESKTREIWIDVKS